MNEHENQTDAEKTQTQLELDKANRENINLNKKIRSLLFENHKYYLKLKIAKEEALYLCKQCFKDGGTCDDSCPLRTVAAILL